MKEITRRDLLGLSAVGLTASSLVIINPQAKADESKPPIDGELVFEFVKAAHKDLPETIRGLSGR